MTEQPIAVRLDAEILDRLDRIGSALSERAAGVRMNRSAVLRVAIEHGIAALETELGLVRQRRKR
jgi:predicted transcriptional regulator